MKSCFTRVILAFGLFIIVLQSNAQTSKNYYTQTGNRLAAEWEPAVGTMITWPLVIPYKLAIELASDNHLYVLIANEKSKKQARQWFGKWGIKEVDVTFIILDHGVDIWWVRDWGPGAVFPKNGKMMLADPKYIYSTPVTSIGCEDTLEFLYKTSKNQIIRTDTDDNATAVFGRGIHMPVLDLPFVATGGNVITDGLGNAFSTCILLNENKFYGVAPDKFFEMNKKMLGINDYHIISNFEKSGIQDIDCYMKLLDEERILICEPPQAHPLHKIYQEIIDNEISKLKTVYGRPYEILRITSDTYNSKDLAAYTNSIIINKTIYVPLFKIKQDSAAMQTWQQVMPGYTVKGFDFLLADEPFVSGELKRHYQSYGWNNGDALHCRTRAVWDPEMLFISIKKLEKEVDTKNSNTVYATIIDYSKKGLIQSKTVLRWRMQGETTWNNVSLTEEGSIHFSASIPHHKPGAVIEYYVTATSNSGKTETMPGTAPVGTYRFLIK